MHKEILDHLAQDSILKNLINTVESPILSPNRDLYQDLIRAIVSQQLSTKAANTIHGRFLDLFADGYPWPEELLAFDIPTLRGVGLSRQKAGYIQNIAEFFVSEKLENKDWTTMDDESIIQYLSQIKGVGKWTVQMILMFTLHRPDVFPVDDLGIQTAMKNLYRVTETNREFKTKLTDIAEAWRPYRTHACLYLWRWKDAGGI